MKAEAIQLRANSSEFAPERPRPLMRELPPSTPFPIDALGSVLGGAAAAINDKVQAPLSTCGQAVLAVATLATQGIANVILPTGQKKPLSCFFMTILETGGRKSACDAEALQPIRAYESSLREIYEREFSEYLKKKLAYERAQEKALKDCKGDQDVTKAALDNLGTPPMSPLHYMITSTEPTFEGLCHHYSIGRPSLGIFATEGGQFIGGHSMSEDAKLRTATGLSNLWDGESIRRVRKGDGVQELRGKRLTVHLQVQPEVGSVMLGDRMLLAQGFLSRVFITAPDSTAGTRMWKEVLESSKLALQAYNKRITEVMKEALPETIRDISLSGDARALWIAFADSVEQDLKSGGVMEPIAGLANKLPEHAARLAAVLSLIENSTAYEVSGAHLAAGIELVKHYAAEALRLFGASKTDVALLQAQKLSAWLRESWRLKESSGLVSLPDIYQCAPISAIRNMSMARKIIGILEEHGHVIPEGVNTVNGERRRETWRIVPEEGL